ncbi:hypothetical protein DPC6323_1626 [Bifidobacterium longum]|nr:hypothetical protein DPC6323_1626 [Bifidobacterium longum]
MIESAARRLAHELVNRREAINRELPFDSYSNLFFRSV